MNKSQMYFQETRRCKTGSNARMNVRMNVRLDRIKANKRKLVQKEGIARFWKSVRLIEDFKRFMEMTGY